MKLDFGMSVKTHAVCEHAHKPPKFNDRCNVEHFDFGSGKYKCRVPHDRPEEKVLSIKLYDIYNININTKFY